MTKRIKLGHFIVRGGMSWGRATSLEEAFRNWLKNERPKRDTTCEAFQVDEGAEVDGLGTLMYRKGAMIRLGKFTVRKTLIDLLDRIEGDIEEMLIPASEKEDIDAQFDGVEVEEEAAA